MNSVQGIDFLGTQQLHCKQFAGEGGILADMFTSRECGLRGEHCVVYPQEISGDDAITNGDFPNFNSYHCLAIFLGEMVEGAVWKANYRP